MKVSFARCAGHSSPWKAGGTLFPFKTKRTDRTSWRVFTSARPAPTGPAPRRISETAPSRAGVALRAPAHYSLPVRYPLALVLLALTLTSCAAPRPVTPPVPRVLPPPQPIITDADQGRVKIQFPTILNLAYQPIHQAETRSLLQAEADRACGVYGRIASQPVSARCTSVQLFSDLPLPQFDEIEHRMNNYGAASGNEHGYCKTQEHLFMCAPADGAD